MNVAAESAAASSDGKWEDLKGSFDTIESSQHEFKASFDTSEPSKARSGSFVTSETSSDRSYIPGEKSGQEVISIEDSDDTSG